LVIERKQLIAFIRTSISFCRILSQFSISSNILYLSS